jgi:hypothetical protein
MMGLGQILTVVNFATSHEAEFGRDNPRPLLDGAVNNQIV